ncbi:MAG: metal-dependent phosphohydrolase [Burkholderiales bacterium]
MNNYILTASGVQFDLEDPQPDMVRVEDIAASLGKLCRFTGHTSCFYSVAQHSILVSHIVPREFAFEGLMHDAAEAYFGDISTPLKRVLGARAREVEHRIDAAVRLRFGLPLSCSPEVKQGDTKALGMEVDYFMPVDPDPWPALTGVEYQRGASFLPLLPAAAADQFLLMFKFFGGK